MDDLPRSVIRYDGWAADAPWRREAEARIEKYRKGDLTIEVTDAAGKPLTGASVEIRMQRHAFGWGTAVDDALINDRQNPDAEHYRQVLTKYFNKVVIENSLKWGRWLDPKHRESALTALAWFQEQKLTARAHVIIWPSWQQTPGKLFTEEVRKDPAAVKKIIADHITDQTTALADKVAEWDVINETFAHHDVIDLLGREAMVDWFKQTRAGAPNVKLFYNDYTMFQKGQGSDYFYNTIKLLKENGAPIDAIGEQGHFGNHPAGIPYVLATLDSFGEFGLPIQISEFDIDTDDEGLQADYMRDFTIAAFSHPSVMGVVQWGFWQGAIWLPATAMWDKNWNLKPNGKVWTDLVSKTWWTNADGTTNADGSYTTRGFYGDYEITVRQGDKIKATAFSLSPQNQNCAVTLP